jgi:hypothetical protein
MNFLTKLDRTRFTSLLDELANDLSKGINNYPANLVEAMQLAQTYRSDGKVIGDMTSSARDNPETAYVTNSYKSRYNKNYKRKSPMMTTRMANTMARAKKRKENASCARSLDTGRINVHSSQKQ